MSIGRVSTRLLCTHGDPADTRCPRCDNGVVEGPFAITVVLLFDEAYPFVFGLYRTEELKEFILRWLCTTPRGVDNLSDSAEQRLEEGDLFPYISHHSTRKMDQVAALPVLSRHRCQRSW